MEHFNFFGLWRGWTSYQDEDVEEDESVVDPITDEDVEEDEDEDEVQELRPLEVF